MSDRAHRSTGRRKAARRRAPRSGRIRALLCLGVIASLGVGSTFAYWTDEGTVTLGEIKSGTLDLTAGPTSGAENLVGKGAIGGSGAADDWAYTAFAINDLIPNESLARKIVLRNSGTAPFRINATLTSTDNSLTSASVGLQVQVYDIGITQDATNSGSQAAGNRSGTCPGTLRLTRYVSTAASGNVWSTPPSLVSNGSQHAVCVRAWLNSDAPNELQGQTTKVKLNVTATQLGAP